MGICHEFWFNKPMKKFDPEVIEMINGVLNSFHKKGLIQLSTKEEEKPVCDEKEICFNGKGDKGYESFFLTPKTKNYHFIKVGAWQSNEYDIVVCIVLLLLKVHYGDKFYLNSDNFCPPKEDAKVWFRAIKYVNTIFKEPKVRLEDVTNTDHMAIRIL